MHYYFNTPDQIAGDEAYNLGEYTQALTHYKHALETLNQLASQRNFKRRNNFLYAFTYVACEIILTTYEAIRVTINDQETFNYEPINNLWKEVPGLVFELETVYAEMHPNNNKTIIKAKMEQCYTVLAELSETISDEFNDRLDETANERDILAALEWLAKAIDYSKRANGSIDINLHLGYLHLLEKGYKANLDKYFLNDIRHYISNNKLLDLPLTPMQTLEILSYQFLVATADNDHTTNQLIQKFADLLSNSDVDKDHPIIEEIEDLITKVPADTHLEIDSIKKRRLNKADEPSDSDDHEDNVITKKSPKKSKYVISEDSDVEEMSTSHTEPESMLPINDHTDTESMLLVTEIQAFYPKDLLTIPSILGNTATFFTNKDDIAKKVTFEEEAHSRAVVKTFTKIVEKASNPEFLANVLSLIGDFYYEKKLPLKNTPLLASELYQAVLLINPKHAVAKERSISMSNHPIIKDNNRYRGRTIFSQESISSIFTKAIKNLVVQIEAFSSEDIAKINKILDANVLYVTEKLMKNNIAGSKSVEIANEINKLYEYYSTHHHATKQPFTM
ncbi:hypothetical protein ACNVED_14805 (plasmid) [Legionella sp. D16C41]|uniref:hypothetical protein n=1 Tax=Legionella sp. D16C41 TaxID=3402688 RepID=UPI003AF96BF5